MFDVALLNIYDIKFPFCDYHQKLSLYMSKKFLLNESLLDDRNAPEWIHDLWHSFINDFILVSSYAGKQILNHF